MIREKFNLDNTDISIMLCWSFISILNIIIFGTGGILVLLATLVIICQTLKHTIKYD